MAKDRNNEPSFLSVLFVSVLVFVLSYYFAQTYLSKKVIDFQRDYAQNLTYVMEKQLETLNKALEEHVINNEEFMMIMERMNRNLRDLGVITKHELKELEKKIHEKAVELQAKESLGVKSSVMEGQIKENVKKVSEKIGKINSKLSDNITEKK